MFQAHRLLYHSTLGLRVIKKKGARTGRRVLLSGRLGRPQVVREVGRRQQVQPLLRGALLPRLRSTLSLLNPPRGRGGGRALRGLRARKGR